MAFQKGDGLPSGWSAVGGQAQSAYVCGGVDPTCSVGGHSTPSSSSSGSAIAVSAGLSPLSIGTETEGSLVQPATRAALYAIKPSSGIIPGGGIVLISHAYDTPGPMAKSPLDLANMLTALVNSTKTKVPSGGYASALAGGWGNLRVGTLDPEVWRFCAEFTNERPEATEQIMHDTNKAYESFKHLAKDYHHNVTLRPETDLDLQGSNALYTLLSADFQKDLEDYLGKLKKTNVRTLKELIEWNIANKDKALPEGYSSQATLIKCLDMKFPESDRERNKAHALEVGASIDETLAKYNIDIIIGPGDSELTQLAASKGYPVAALPLSTLRFNGRPIGLVACVPAHKEALLFQLMAAWESSFPARAQPLGYSGKQQRGGSEF